MLNTHGKFSNEWQRCSGDSGLCTSAMLSETGSNVMVKVLPTSALRMPQQHDLELGHRYSHGRPNVRAGSCGIGSSRDYKEHLLRSEQHQHNAGEVQEVIFEYSSSTTSEQMSSNNEQAVNSAVEVQQSVQSSIFCGFDNSSNHSLTASNVTPFNLTGTSKSFQSPLKRKQRFSGQDEVSDSQQNAATVSDSDRNNLLSSCSSSEGLKTKRANKEPLVTLESTSTLFPPVGPNDFQLNISLSQDPWDMSTQDAEWLFVDKTGQQLALNLNTSLLLDHLYNSCSRFNSMVRISLPETGRTYDISLKKLEMTDVCTGEKTALLRKSWTPSKPLQ